MAHHGADDDRVALDLERLQVGDRTEVDEIGRRGEAQLHRLHQALPAGEVAAFALLLGERQRVLGAVGAVVLECVHGFS